MDTDTTGPAAPLDRDKASPAGIYDYLLRGRYHSEADRQAAEKLLEVAPFIGYLVAANRRFLRRAVAAMARAGVDQFLDIGAGLPTALNTHEAAQRVNPDARIAYVDSAPDVVAEARRLLAESGDPGVVYVQGDVTDPDGILGNPQVRDHIDFSRPVGVLMIALLHFVPDEQDPHGLVARYMDAVPSGSYLALTHITRDGQDPDVIGQLTRIYGDNATSRAYFRNLPEIDRFFTGLEFLPPYEGAAPGRSFVDLWGASDPSTVQRGHTFAPAGVARKP